MITELLGPPHPGDVKALHTLVTLKLGSRLLVPRNAKKSKGSVFHVFLVMNELWFGQRRQRRHSVRVFVLENVLAGVLTVPDSLFSLHVPKRED